jgi:L-rhamnose mutarotase
MKSYAMTILLRDDPTVIEAYRFHHAHAWGEVVAGLKEVGVLEMRIWLRGRALFMLAETVDEFDWDGDFARYEAGDPRRADWQRTMERLQEPVPDAASGEWWAPMERVFDLNG